MPKTTLRCPANHKVEVAADEGYEARAGLGADQRTAKDLLHSCTECRREFYLIGGFPVWKNVSDARAALLDLVLVDFPTEALQRKHIIDNAHHEMWSEKYRVAWMKKYHVSDDEFAEDVVGWVVEQLSGEAGE